MKLVYTSDQTPGYRRVRSGKGFSYRLPDGQLVKDRRELQRILSLAIPPAYESVWVCIHRADAARRLFDSQRNLRPCPRVTATCPTPLNPATLLTPYGDGFLCMGGSHYLSNARLGRHLLGVKAA